MRIAPTCHFTMGGLWSDFNQMTSIPGLFTGGECSWTYHGANRLGANSLLSASVDGWFTLPFSVPNYLGPLLGQDRLSEDAPEVAEKYPMADTIRESLELGAPRPQTPYYNEVSTAIQQRYAPPSGVSESTPAETDDFIQEVLRGERLL